MSFIDPNPHATARGHHLGHEVQCLAHLAPAEGLQEMDSYMYQTAACMEILWP